MNVPELVTAARTCRRFRQEEGLPGSTLEWLVNCARLTPCAGNAQVLRYAAAVSPKACADLFPALKWAALLKDWDGPVEGERPTGYIVILEPAGGQRGRLNMVDCGIAAQTMQLAAQSRGIGTCMLLSFNHDLARQVLDIPADYDPLMVLAFGMQKEVRVVETADGGPTETHYWRDEAAVHHVPKLALDRVLIIRK